MIRGALALIMVLAMATACGGPSADERLAEKNAAAEKAEAKEDAKRQAEELAAKQVQFDQCNSTVSDLLADLQTLDSKLSVGMIYRDYTDAVGNARAKLDAMVRVVKNDPTLKQALIDSGCTPKVLVPLGKAMFQYGNASDVWTDCFSDLYCDIDDSPEGTQLDVHWTRATDLIERATKNLNTMQPSATPSPTADSTES